MRELKPHLVRLSPEKRLHGIDRPIIGLTGGIATGKSTVSRLLRDRGLSIIDADQLVKSIYQREDAKEFIGDNFPEAWRHGEILFPKLREIVFQNTEAKKKVEEFVYVRLPDAFTEAASKITDQTFLIYDVPLLFEKNLQEKVDLSVVVYAPRKIQIPRIMDRDGHLEELAKKILDQQMDIEEKKQKADFIVDNSASMVELAAEVDQLLLQILH